MVPALATVRFTSPSSDTLPPRFITPLLSTSPSVSAPLIANAFAKVRVVEESLDIRPPLKLTRPVPKAALFPASIAPALRLTPPLNVLAPVTVNTEVPVFTRLPAPLITPL